VQKRVHNGGDCSLHQPHGSHAKQPQIGSYFADRLHWPSGTSKGTAEEEIALPEYGGEGKLKRVWVVGEERKEYHNRLSARKHYMAFLRWESFVS